MVEMVVMRHPHVRVRGGIEERPLVVTCKLCRRENAMDVPEVIYCLLILHYLILLLGCRRLSQHQCE
jgi:hypothetical protein